MLTAWRPTGVVSLCLCVSACVVVRERRGGGTERKKSPEARLHLYFKNSSRRASERDGILSPGVWVTSLSRDVWAIQLLMLGPKEICPHLESGRGAFPRPRAARVSLWGLQGLTSTQPSLSACPSAGTESAACSEADLLSPAY